MCLLRCIPKTANQGSTLWENLRDEIQDPKEALPGSSDEEMGEPSNFPFPESLLLGSGTMNKDLSALHPTPVQIFRLWQTFLVNVNPLIKVFHAPTVQQMILDATGDLKKVPRPIEALMFGIYFLSISSLSNEECEGMFGESRLSLLAKYSHGAQQSLINSRFMKSLSIITLQSYVLYLVRPSPSILSSALLMSLIAWGARRLRPALFVGPDWCCCPHFSATRRSSRWCQPSDITIRC